MEHVWPEARSESEVRQGVTWCRRCCRMLAKDRHPGWVQAKPCEVVRVALR